MRLTPTAEDLVRIAKAKHMRDSLLNYLSILVAVMGSSKPLFTL